MRTYNRHTVRCRFRRKETAKLVLGCAYSVKYPHSVFKLTYNQSAKREHKMDIGDDRAYCVTKPFCLNYIAQFTLCMRKHNVDNLVASV